MNIEVNATCQVAKDAYRSACRSSHHFCSETFDNRYGSRSLENGFGMYVWELRKNRSLWHK